MSERFDTIVIGGGVNGLTAAIRMARAGRRTLLCEAREHLGGLAASEEFHPGYRTCGVDHDDSRIRPWWVQKLQLERHGLQLRPEPLPTFSPEPAGEGPGLMLWRDADRAAPELGDDASAYAEFRGFLDRVTPFLRRTIDQIPADLAGRKLSDLWQLARSGIALRLLGRADMMELFRIGPMCVADWLGEWFGSDRLRATLAAPAVFGGFTAPWSPGTNANLLLHETFAGAGARGGGPSLVAALEVAARDAGVEVRTGTPVAGIEVGEAETRGVRLEGGETIEAPLVTAACSAKRALLELVPVGRLSLRLEHGIQNFRTRGTTARIHLALTAYPSWASRPDETPIHVCIGDGIDALERAFDPIKYRAFGSDLALDVRIPTVESPDLAPAGHHVLSAAAHWVPERLEGGWTDASRQDLLQTVLRRLEVYAPGIRESVVGSEVLAPPDLESRYGLVGGQIHHGEHGLDQLVVRPTPECARYATPIPGLFLCGGGSYPGGGITGVPGFFAAERMLEGA